MNATMLPAYENLTRGVQRFGGFRKRWNVYHGAALFVLAGPGLLALWFLLDWALRLPLWLLLASFAVITVVSLWAAVRWLIKPQLRVVDLEREALTIEHLHRGLDNQIIGPLQLGREMSAAKAQSSLGYSRDIASALIGRSAAKLDEVQAENLIDLRTARRTLQAALAVVLIGAGCLVLAPGAVRERAERLSDAWAWLLDTIFPVEFKVLPGDLAIVRGRPLELTVDCRGARRNSVLLVRTGEKGESPLADSLALDNARHASFRLDKAMEGFTYHFEYGNRRSPEHKILVGDLPEINAINCELTFPAYTGQSPRTLTGRFPRLQALAGTSVLVSFSATTALHPDSYVEWLDGSRQGVQISGRFGHFAFTIGRPDRATLHLTGIYGRGFEMAQPLIFDIAVQRDEPPTVQIMLKTKKITMMAENAAFFGFDWLAEDDYGVAEVALEYKIDTIDELLRRPKRDGKLVRAIEPARDRAKGTFKELFKDLNPPLEPGDRITITLTARDNNTETGPGIGRSLPVEIVIVRPDLSAFMEQQYGFGNESVLGGLKKVKRATDLLVDPPKTVRSETVQKIEKQQVKARVTQESWPSGSEDAVGDYFRLLSGEK